MHNMRLAEVVVPTPTPTIVDTVLEVVLERGVVGATRENYPSVLAHACQAIELLPSGKLKGAEKKQAAMDVLKSLMVRGGVSETDATSLEGAASACIDALVGAAKGEFRLQTPKDCWSIFRRAIAAIKVT
jgi:hypothetical protein